MVKDGFRTGRRLPLALSHITHLQDGGRPQINQDIRNETLKDLIIRYYENDNIHVSKVTDFKNQKQLDFEDDLKPFSIFKDPVDKNTTMFQIKVVDQKKAQLDTNWKGSLYQFLMLSKLSISQTTANLRRANQIQEMIKKEIRFE